MLETLEAELGLNEATPVKPDEPACKSPSPVTCASNAKVQVVSPLKGKNDKKLRMLCDHVISVAPGLKSIGLKSS